MSTSFIESLGLRSDLFFWQRATEIVNSGDLTALIPPEKPSWWTTNIVIAPKAPEASEIEELAEQCDRLLRRYARSPRYLLFCRSGKLSEESRAKYEQLGFSYDSANVLTLRKEPVLPPSLNSSVEIIEVATDSPLWTSIIQLNVECFAPEGDDGRYARATRFRFADYRKMLSMDGQVMDAGENSGIWYAAMMDGELAGSFGIFRGEDFYRYQQVAVRPKFRGQGVAATMLYHAAMQAFRANPDLTQVLVADRDSRIQRLYESLGFTADSEQEVIRGNKLSRRPVALPDVSHMAR